MHQPLGYSIDIANMILAVVHIQLLIVFNRRARECSIYRYLLLLHVCLQWLERVIWQIFFEVRGEEVLPAFNFSYDHVGALTIRGMIDELAH